MRERSSFCHIHQNIQSCLPRSNVAMYRFEIDNFIEYNIKLLLLIPFGGINCKTNLYDLTL